MALLMHNQDGFADAQKRPATIASWILYEECHMTCVAGKQEAPFWAIMLATLALHHRRTQALWVAVAAWLLECWSQPARTASIACNRLHTKRSYQKTPGRPTS